MRTSRKTPLWRDRRFWHLAVQGFVVVVVVAGAVFLWSNLSRNLQLLGVRQGFGFLESQASFPIGETPISYTPADSYGRALLVGLVNFLRAITLGIPLTTLLGITIGVARLSSNWLVRQLALVYVESLRNTPLLLQLIFWYATLSIGLPAFENRIELPGPIYLSKQGAALPGLTATAATLPWLAILALGLALGLSLHRWRLGDRRERLPGLWCNPGVLGWVALVVAAAIAGLATGSLPWRWNPPTVGPDLQIQGGITLSSEFLALLLGLVLYTAAFIAEIVRAGITSVSKGQQEAAKALGLSPSQSLRLVIFPQALRVIVPPLTNQYLNLSKNSSLAIAVGYPDIYSIASTTASQKSQTVEIVLLIMVTYLSLSLTISLIMNRFNRRLRKNG